VNSTDDNPIRADASTASNVADLLSHAAAESGEKTALVDAETGRRVTWGELDAEVSRVASGLSEMGLVAGYRVVIAIPNRVEFVTSYLAALRARMVAVPVNPRGATGELVRVLADCGARAVICDSSTVTQVRSAVGGLSEALEGADEELRRRAAVPRVVVCGATAHGEEVSYDDLARTTAGEIPLPEDSEALAVLLYTSGTSGQPRAAMLSHRALVANIEQGAAVEPPMVTADDVVFGVLPLFHVYGLNAVLGQVIRQHSCLVLVNGFDVEGSLDIIEDEAVDVVPVAPAVLAYWMSVEDLANRLSGVRLVLSGSAPLSPKLVESFSAQTRVDVHQGYGLTEAAPVVTSTLCSDGAKAGSVGSAMPGITVKLVDEAGQQPEGEDAGEIYLKGGNLFSGYWPDGADGPDQDGWWPTGDVGFLDAEGDLFLVDRLKELVIVSGFNVYPSEVEEVITEIDAVAEAAVIGAEDERTGESVVAYVKKGPAATISDEQLVVAVREHCATRLARFKQPEVVHVVDELPHTVTGKVAKGTLRASEWRRAVGILE